MTESDWEKLKDLFEIGVELPPTGRESFIVRVRSDHPQLADELASLLENDEAANGFLGGKEPKWAFVPDMLVAGRYRIKGELGSGGMGAVYEVFDTELSEAIALKVIHPEDSDDKAAVGRLILELQLARRITHPNVCRVYDVGRHSDETGDVPFITMELLSGQTLAARLKESGPLSSATALVMARQIADGIDAAHFCGVVHRDLKPSNIMITVSGRVVITDFGIARMSAAAAVDSVTRRSQVIGTPAYMAPEQLIGARITPACDIYAFGVILYEMLTGRTPLDGGHAATLEPTSWRPAIEKALAVDAGRRFPTARSLVDNLPRLQSSLPLFRWRNWVLVAAVVILTVLLLGQEIRLRYLNPLGRYASATQVVVDRIANNSGDSFFDYAPRELLGIALEESPKLSVSLIEGGETGYAPRLRGDVTGSQGRYRITLRLVSAGTRDSTFEGEFAGRQDLRPAIDRLAVRVRTLFGEDEARIRATTRRLDEVTTSSDSALELFSQAVELESKADVKGALLLLNKAVDADHDPSFALAHEHLAVALSGLGQRDEALTAAASAYALRKRATEREQYLITGTYRFLRDEFQSAADAYKTGTIRFPNDPLAYRYLAQVDSRLAKYDEALGAVNRLLQLDPRSTIDYRTRIMFLMESGRFGEAINAGSKVRSENIVPDYLNWPESLALLGEGHDDEAKAAFERLRADSSGFQNAAELYSTQVAMHEGDFQGAIDALENQLQFEVQYQSGSFGALRQYWLAELYLILGKRNSALAHIAVLAEQPELPTHLTQLKLAGLLYARTNQIESARRALASLSAIQEKSLASEAPEAYLHLVSGEIHQQTGELDIAIRDLDSARALRNDPIGILYSARALRERGDFGRARALYAEFISRHGEVLRWEPEALWVLAHFEEAECEERLNLYTEAEKDYQVVVDLWGRSAPNAPQVRDASRGLARIKKSKSH